MNVIIFCDFFSDFIIQLEKCFNSLLHSAEKFIEKSAGELIEVLDKLKCKDYPDRVEILHQQIADLQSDKELAEEKHKYYRFYYLIYIL